MIWLASFPRSGNTFLRNILFEVYGQPSSTYHWERDYPLDQDFDSYPVVKTHLLPADLDSAGFSPDIPAVCLVRDGRDALCSIAHHRSDLIAPGSDYIENLTEAIIADRGSYFGGWSINVEAWLARADLVIRYEDLIADPIAQAERLRQVLDLPPGDPERLPTFAAMKSGVPEYGAGKHQALSDDLKQERAQKFFRRGQAGAWREEMPEELHDLFWSYHGETMARLGYGEDGDIRPPHRDLDIDLSIKLGVDISPPGRKYRVLIEADKLVSRDNDGIKRYQVELLRAMLPAATHPLSRWQIELLHHGRVSPIGALIPLLSEDFAGARPDHGSDAAPSAKAPQRPLEGDRGLHARIIKPFGDLLRRHHITLLHDLHAALRATPNALRRLDVKGHALWRALALRLRLRHNGRFGWRQDAYDLVHIPLPQHYRPFRRTPIPKLITVHDLTNQLFPQFHTADNNRKTRAGMAFAQRSGAHIIAVSDATRADLLAHTSIPPARVHVIHEAANPKTFQKKVNCDDKMRVRARYAVDFSAPYIISLSTLEPRKNLQNTIRAFASLREAEPDLDVKLVIAGKRGWDADGVYSLAREHQDSVLFTDFVDDADLAFLFSDAICLSYLSFYEGFGLPPLEAMRCGTPVVYGDNSALREVVADAGLPANPEDIADIRRQYLALLRDQALRHQLGKAALRRANQFSWRTAAVATLALYERVIDA
jgi:glycosyltransferase involved in cell wall biosynthesis